LGASAASLAPNGRWLAYVRTDAQFTLEERLVDLERQQETRLFAPPHAPPDVRSPDAELQTFRGVVMGTPGIYLRNLNGGREELLLREDKNMRIPSNWTRNNRWILFTEITEQTRGDIWMVPSPGRGSEARPVPLLQTPANESQGQVSPDGRWIAYSSDETGSDQVYVRPFAERDLGREPVWAVPTAGGREPRWRADGKELFYLVRVPGTSRVRVMSVPVGATQNPLGDAKALFEVPVGLTVPQNNNFAYDASSDGQRFVFMTLAAEARPSLDVLLNWAGNQSR
jgi:Tol biopolymer transport system component